MNNPKLLRLLFWANIFFMGINLLGLLVSGSIFSGLVCALNAYCAYTLRQYA